MLRHKLIRAETKVLDAKEGLVSAIVSNEEVDRDGDIIRVAGWDFTNFMKLPLLIADHDYKLDSVIGDWQEIKVVKTRKAVEGIAHYHINEGNVLADKGFKLAEKGLAAFSVGFRPDMAKAKELESDDPWFMNFEFNGQELLEVSHVTIPSNPEALQRAKGLKLHPVLDDIIAEALGATSTKSVHGEHDHDENGRHDHDEDKALLLAQVRELIKSELSPALFKEVDRLVHQELAIFKAEQIVPPDYLAIAQRAKQEVQRGYYK